MVLSRVSNVKSGWKSVFMVQNTNVHKEAFGRNPSYHTSENQGSRM
ncbi:hypothetical protein OROGR_000770 [Orobanche gracilis]